jgi:hypothetical protein
LALLQFCFGVSLWAGQFFASCAGLARVVVCRGFPAKRLILRQNGNVPVAGLHFMKYPSISPNMRFNPDGFAAG